MSTKLEISWDKATKDINLLVERLREVLLNKNGGQPLNISKLRLVIPCRGGEIIGSLVKNSLGLREKQLYRIKFSNLKYEEGKESVIIKDRFDHERFLDLIEEEDPSLLWIFIDDLVDSGLTIDYIRESLYPKNITIGVLYSKEGKNKEKTDICIEDLEDKWIVFPWENFYEK